MVRHWFLVPVCAGSNPASRTKFYIIRKFIIKKLAIITSGGGMACSYGAGVASALVKEYGLTDPDIVIAGSGSAGTMSYFVARQYKLVTNIWSELLSTKKFINPLRFWRIMDIDYLIDTVFKIKAPLDTEQIYSSKINFLIPTTNYYTGDIRYYSNQNHDDIFEALRATKAMPIIYGKRVSIDGEEYCDSLLTSNTDAHIKKAIELGATHLIIVNTGNPQTRRGLIYKLWLATRSSVFKQKYTSEENLVRDYVVPKNIQIATLTPNLKTVKRISNDKELLLDSIKCGYKDCRDNLRLKKLLNSYSSTRLQTIDAKA